MPVQHYKTGTKYTVHVYNLDFFQDATTRSPRLKVLVKRGVREAVIISESKDKNVDHRLMYRVFRKKCVFFSQFTATPPSPTSL